MPNFVFILDTNKHRFVALATLFLLVSCKPVPVFTNNEIPCSLPTKEQTNSSSQPLEIALHVDGSGSMLGYVNQPQSRYIQTLELLDSILLTGGSRPKTTLEYYRSTDSKKNPPIPRSDYRQAKEAQFYDGTNPKFPPVSSQLDTAITAPDKTDRLLVFVTDLEQNEGDVNNLSHTIEENYLKNPNYAVGILAIRSEFKGTVYTTDPKSYPNYDYDTTQKSSQEYRPFYILFLGPYSDIDYYYQQIKKSKPDLINDSQFIIFNPHQIITQASYLEGNPTLPEGIERPPSLNNGKVAVEVTTPPYDLLEIGKRLDQKEFTISYSLPFHPLNNTLTPNTLSTQTQLKTYLPFEKTFKQEPLDSSLTQALELKNLQIENNNQLKFTTILRPETLNNPGIYLFNIDITASDLQEAPWWKEWDRETQKNINDGSKTYNFLNFMQNLKRSTITLMTSQNQQTIPQTPTTPITPETQNPPTTPDPQQTIPQTPTTPTTPENQQTIPQTPTTPITPIIGRLCYAIQKN